MRKKAIVAWVECALPDKEVLERLRKMIRELESRAAVFPSGQQPAHGFVSARGGPPPLPGPFCPAPPVPAAGGESVLPRAQASRRDPLPLSSAVTEGDGYSVMRTVYGEGAFPELYMPSAGSLEGFRALEPSLASLEGWVYLDIETTGLIGAGTIAFLVGLGRWTDEGFAVEQYLLTSRQGEEAMLDSLAGALMGKSVLVTYNGKAFDVPVLQSRYILAGMRCPFPLKAHLDFLSITKALGRRAPYGQSLKEAVRRFTGYTRESDIPGNMIPALYFIYEKEGDLSVLSPVLKHNFLDVVDMACLAYVFGEILTAGPASGDPEALSGAGKLHLRRGNLEMARRCLETAGSCAPEWRRMKGDAEASRLRLLAKVLRRQGDWERAIDALETLLSLGPAKDEDYLFLARCYEVGRGDLDKAMEIVSSALERYAGGTGEVPESLLKRKRRLLKAISQRGRVREA